DIASMVGHREAVQTVTMRNVDAAGKKMIADGRRHSRVAKRLAQSKIALDDPVVDAAAKPLGMPRDRRLVERFDIRPLRLERPGDKMNFHVDSIHRLEKPRVWSTSTSKGFALGCANVAGRCSFERSRY